MENTILVHATIIDCTGADPRPEGWVVLEGDRIKEVGHGRPGVLPAKATVIDCQGQTLLPGLIDGHVHIGSVEASIVEQQRTCHTSTLIIKSLKILKETLDQGFTTARDCGGVDAGFRQAVAEGLVPGPRLFVSGRILSQTGGHGDWRLATETYPPVFHEGGVASGIYDGVDAVRRGAREQLRRGADFVKIMASGGCASPADEIDTSQYSLEEMQAAVFEAESAGKYVAAHCYSDRGIKLCCKAGIKTIEHGNLLTESSAQAMKDAGTYLVPTMVTYVVLAQKGAEYGAPKDWIRKNLQALEKGEQSMAIARKVGVKICSGSDLLGPMQVNKGMELALQAKALGPMGALIATTRTNAEMLGQSRNLGTIEPGKLADFVLVKGDPLKDIALFQDYDENITLIIQNGRIHKNILTGGR
ncbi:MAG: amidohydrolase family protein [Holophaga sp.]|jgi:imidazolonepropionase-like amidohydrolase